MLPVRVTVPVPDVAGGLLPVGKLAWMQRQPLASFGRLVDLESTDGRLLAIDVNPVHLAHVYFDNAGPESSPEFLTPRQASLLPVSNHHDPHRATSRVHKGQCCYGCGEQLKAEDMACMDCKAEIILAVENAKRSPVPPENRT